MEPEESGPRAKTLVIFGVCLAAVIVGIIMVAAIIGG